MTTLQCLRGIGIILLIIAVIIAIRIYRKSTKNNKDQKNSFDFSVILNVIGFLLSFISSLLLLTINVDKPIFGNETTTPSEVSTIETTSQVTTTESTTKETTSETTTLETTTNPPIRSNEIPLNFTIEDQEIRREFTAPTSGKYRFNFIIDDVTCDYTVELFDLKNERLFNTYYSTSEHGKSYRLTEGEKYRIVITQYKGFTTGKIKIGVPEEVKVIEFN